MGDEAKLAALAKAAHALNRAGVAWGVGASALLYLEKVAESYRDFDLLLTADAMDEAKHALLGVGAAEAPPAPASGTYASQAFWECALDSAELDLIGGFTIRRKDGVYRYPFGRERIARWVDVQGERVPLSPLEDWYVLYLLMPGRAKQAALLGRYLRANPREHSRLWLNLWLSNRLPGEVRERVLALYNGIGMGG